MGYNIQEYNLRSNACFAMTPYVEWNCLGPVETLLWLFPQMFASLPRTAYALISCTTAQSLFVFLSLYPLLVLPSPHCQCLVT